MWPRVLNDSWSLEPQETCDKWNDFIICMSTIHFTN